MLRQLLFIVAAVVLVPIYVGAAGLMLLKLLNFELANVASDSMRPALAVGDSVLIKKGKPARLTAGQLISYRLSQDPETTVTHRIIMNNSDTTIVTKGDANPAADHPLLLNQIIGQPVARLPGLGVYLEAFRSLPVVAGLVILPSMVLIVLELLRLIKRLSTKHYLIDYSYAKKKQKANPLRLH